MKKIEIKDDRTGEIRELPLTATLAEILGEMKMSLDDAAQHMADNMKGLSKARAIDVLNMIIDEKAPYLEAIQAARRGDSTEVVLTIEPVGLPKATADVSKMDPAKIAEAMADQEPEEKDQIEEPRDLHAPQEPSHQFQEGVNARRHGWHSDRNPHHIDSQEREEWYLGWKHSDENEDSLPEVEMKAELPETDQDETAEPDDGQTDNAEPEGYQDEETQEVLTPEKAGHQARLHGAGADENPYDGGTEDHQSWAHAYHSADVEIKKVIETGAKDAAEGKSEVDCPWKKGTDAERFWLEGFNKYISGLTSA